MQIAKSIIVSFSKNLENNSCVLIVGDKQPKKDVEIINAFDGPEAEELWNKLVTKKEKSCVN